MVHLKGFEPLTSWFVAKHSIQLSYRCLKVKPLINKGSFLYGGSEWNRTIDTRIFSPLLLPTELQSQMAVSTGIEPAIFCVTGRRDNRYTTRPLGCGRWI